MPREQRSPLRWSPLNLGTGAQRAQPDFQTAKHSPRAQERYLPSGFISGSWEGTARHKSLGNWRTKRRWKRALISER